MEISPQTQKAGDNAQQIQAGTIIINNGISEERVRVIFSEMLERAIQEYTCDAYEKARKRIQEFEKSLASIIERHEQDLSFFAEPSFQFALKKAQLSSAKTEDKNDYDLLAELLDSHIKHNEDRKKKAAINKALDIVSEIDNQALCALTVACAFSNLIPNSGNVEEGLNFLEKYFSKLLYLELPQGRNWLDHLDILSVMRVSSITRVANTSSHYATLLNGYFCIGILKNSSKHYDAVRMLTKVGISPEFLVEHELLANHVRLQIASYKSIDDLVASEEQKEVIKKVYKLYDSDVDLLKKVSFNFIKRLEQLPHLHLIQKWWDLIPNYFEFTLVGHLLALTNMRRLSDDTPPADI